MAGQVQFVIEQVIQCMLEGAGEQLLGENNREKLRTRIDRLVAGHRALHSTKSRHLDLAARP